MPKMNRAELPLPDYDHLPLEALRHRVRPLGEDDVRDLIAFEEEHGRRLPVLEVLRTRLESLKQGAEPSSGSAQGRRPEMGSPKRTGSAVPEQTAPPRHDLPPPPTLQEPDLPKRIHQTGNRGDDRGRGRQ